MPTTLDRMPRKATGKTATVRISERIVRMIDIISTAEGVSSAQVCDPILESVIVERYQRALKFLNEEGKLIRKPEERK